MIQATSINIHDTWDNSSHTMTWGGSYSGMRQYAVTVIHLKNIPTISIDNVTVAEGNAGTTNATFTVSLSGGSSSTITVKYATADGTADQPDDYTKIAATTLTFDPGDTTKTVTVLVNGDTSCEPNETFYVNLTVPTNATILDNQGVGTINNDDAPPTVTFTAAAQSKAEGSAGTAKITAQLSSVKAGYDVTVPFTVAGTATEGSAADYTITASPITIDAGEASADITVTVKNDTLDEDDETVIVTMGESDQRH